MLKKCKAVQHEAPHTYAPPLADAVINTHDIVTVVPIQKHLTRVQTPLVQVVLRDGRILEVAGEVKDFADPAESWQEERAALVRRIETLDAQLRAAQSEAVNGPRC